VCGLNKRLEDPEFNSFIESYDLILLMETKIDDTDVDIINEHAKQLKLKCYFHNRFALAKPKSGGIIVLYKEHLQHNIQELKTDSKFVKWFMLNVKCGFSQKKMLFGAVYIPPESSVYANPSSFDEVENELISIAHETTCVFLAGDFNAHTATKADYFALNEDMIMEMDMDLDEASDINIEDKLNLLGIPTQRGSSDMHRVDNFGNRLLEMCKSNQLVICNGRLGNDCGTGYHTTTTGSVIDYAICSPDLIQDIEHFEVLDFNELFSDIHCGICVHIKLSSAELNESSVPDGQGMSDEAGGGNNDTYLVWDDKKNELFENNLNLMEIENVLHNIEDGLNLDDICQNISNVFVNSAKECQMFVKKKNHAKRSNIPGFNRDCKQTRRDYHRLKNKYNRVKSHDNEIAMKNSRNLYKVTLRKAVSKHKNDMQKKIRNMKSNNTKDFWRLINKKTKDKICIPVKDLKNHFEKINSCVQDEGDQFDINRIQNRKANALLDKNFTKEEILVGIKQLKNGKSRGVDEIYNEYIKYSAHKMLDVWVKLFNRILHEGKIPEKWLIGLIVPIYKKKGDSKDPNNYRGITLLSCLGKLFTSVVNNRLKLYAEASEMISDKQAGFRKDHSTLDNTFVLKCLIDLFLSNNKKLYCAFVDYEKAFDRVWRAGLWYKLITNGIDGKLFNVIHNMYQDIKSCVMVDQEKSDFFGSMIGVRQGENLSPLLFSIFVNDIEDYLLTCGCKPICIESDMYINKMMKLCILMYADDTVLLSDSPSGLQAALDSLSDYCTFWKLKVNAMKTKV